MSTNILIFMISIVNKVFLLYYIHHLLYNIYPLYYTMYYILSRETIEKKLLEVTVEKKASNFLLLNRSLHFFVSFKFPKPLDGF